MVIAGASSLLGAEVRALLEEGRFAGSDVRLVDEPFVAGVLTAAGGEPAIIQPVEEVFKKRKRCFLQAPRNLLEPIAKLRKIRARR